MKSAYTWASLCLLMLASLLVNAQTTVQFNLGDFGANPAAARNVQVKLLSAPSVFGGTTVINTIGTFTTDAGGFLGLTNVASGLYSITVLAPPQRTDFMILVTSTNLGVVNANTILAAASTATFPSASVAWAAAVTDSRYTRQSNSFGTLLSGTPGVSVSGGANALNNGNATISVTNLPEAYISNLVADLTNGLSWTTSVSNLLNSSSLNLTNYSSNLVSVVTNKILLTTNVVTAITISGGSVILTTNASGISAAFTVTGGGGSGNGGPVVIFSGGGGLTVVSNVVAGVTNYTITATGLTNALPTNTASIIIGQTLWYSTNYDALGAALNATNNLAAWATGFFDPLNAALNATNTPDIVRLAVLNSESNALVTLMAQCTNTIGIGSGLSAFVSTNRFDTNGAAIYWYSQATNFDITSLLSASNALSTLIQQSTNGIGFASGMSAFVSTNRFDTNGAGLAAALSASNILAGLNTTSSNALAGLIVASTNTPYILKSNSTLVLAQFDGSTAPVGGQMIYNGANWVATNRWVGSNILYVATNGVDATARLGDRDFPWKHPGLAISNAVAGQTVFLLPGDFPVEGGAVTIPDGVNVIGSGQDVSIMHFGPSFDSNLQLRKNQIIQDLSLMATLSGGYYGAAISYDASQPYMTNLTVRRVTVTGGGYVSGAVTPIDFNFGNNTNQINAQFYDCTFVQLDTSSSTLGYGWNIAATNRWVTNSTLYFDHCHSYLANGTLAPNSTAYVAAGTPLTTWMNCDWLMTNGTSYTEGGDNRMTFVGCHFKMDSRPTGAGVPGDYILISQVGLYSQPGYSPYIGCDEQYWLTSSNRYIGRQIYQADAYFNGLLVGSGNGLTNLDLSKQQAGTVTSAQMSNSIVLGNLTINSNLNVSSYNLITTSTNWIYVTGEGQGIYQWLSAGLWININLPAWRLYQAAGITYEQSNSISIWQTANLITNVWTVVLSSGSSPVSMHAPQLLLTGVPLLGSLTSTSLVAQLQSYSLTLSNQLSSNLTVLAAASIITTNASGTGTAALTNDSRVLSFTNANNVLSGNGGGLGNLTANHVAPGTVLTNVLIMGDGSWMTNLQSTNLVGMTNASVAAAGFVGQVISTNVPVGSPVAMVSAQAINVTWVTLSPGDWDVSGNVNITVGGAACINYSAGISTNSATLPTDGTEINVVASTAYLTNGSLALTTKVVNVAATTKVYLVAWTVYTGSVNSGYGSLTARRVR